MSKENNSVVIKYKTGQEFCHCCEQKLPEVKISQVREFQISNHDLFNYAPWKELIEYGDDLEECVKEFVYDTISFFSVNSYETILVDKSEFSKVEQFILNAVKQEGYYG